MSVNVISRPLRAISENPVWNKEEDISCSGLFWKMEAKTLQHLHRGENPALDGGLSPMSLDLTFICDQTESFSWFESDQTLWTLAISSHQWAPAAGLSGGAGPCSQIPGKAVD